MKQQQLLSDAIEDYERFRRSMDIAKSTLKGERSTLMRLLAVTGNIYVSSFAEFHLTRFFTEISKTKQPQSQRNDYRTLNGFFDWARRTGRMALDNDPLYGRRKPRRVQREKTRLHVSKFPALLNAAEARCARDRAIVALALYTLCRSSEISDMRIRDLDLDAGYLLVRIHKTRQEDRVPICAELDREMRRWLTYYSNAVGHLEPNYFLVPSRSTRALRSADGRGIGGNVEVSLRPEKGIYNLGKMISPCLEAVGVDLKDSDGRGLGEGAHTLRRSGARALFDDLLSKGVDYALEIVQSMLHHASSNQTQQYIGFQPSRRKRDDLLRGREMYHLAEVTELRPTAVQ